MPASDFTDQKMIHLHLRQLQAAGYSPNSVRARVGALRRLARDLDPDEENRRALIEADSADLTTWQASLELHPASVAKYVQHVRIFYAWLVRPMRVIEESPALDLVKPLVKRRLPRPIPEDELAFALDACADKLVYSWLVLGAYAGLRSIDVAALRTDDLLLTGEVAMLRVRGKGGDEDLVAVGQQVVEVLAPFRGRKGVMFAYDDGRPIKCTTIDDRVNEYLARVGLPYTFHQLRHRFGTKVYEITRDILYTQKQMRHASVVSTQIYTLVTDENRTDVLDIFDASLEKHSAHKRKPQ